jgi:hypothetical protein
MRGHGPEHDQAITPEQAAEIGKPRHSSSSVSTAAPATPHRARPANARSSLKVNKDYLHIKHESESIIAVLA